MATVKLTNIRSPSGTWDIIKGVSLAIEDAEFCVFSWARPAAASPPC